MFGCGEGMRNGDELLLRHKKIILSPKKIIPEFKKKKGQNINKYRKLQKAGSKGILRMIFHV